jgi:3-oxoacyl-[acyl-carrier protein] reductase
VAGGVTGMSDALADLAGLGVLITGASTGIGAAAAKAFAAHEARVAIHYNRSAEAARAVHSAIVAAGGEAQLIAGDLSEKGRAADVVATAASKLGRLDVLINNAGAIIERRPFAEIMPDLYEASLDLNVRPVIEACIAALPHLEKSGQGSIVNVGSIAGADGGGPGSGHYAAAKGYIHTFTRHMARDLASRSIRVNAIAPGVIDTPFHSATPPERMEAMRKSVPLGRAGKPEDCTGVLLFLASSAMSGYITGQVIHVNGGQLMA